jgi:hypothetical protein
VAAASSDAAADVLGIALTRSGDQARIDDLARHRDVTGLAKRCIEALEQGMALSQTSSSRTISNPMRQQPVNLVSQDDMSVVGGATIERSTRINRPDDENTRCSVSNVRGQPKDFSQTHAATYNGWHRCVRRSANARKFQGYSGERGNYKCAAI